MSFSRTYRNQGLAGASYSQLRVTTADGDQVSFQILPGGITLKNVTVQLDAEQVANLVALLQRDGEPAKPAKWSDAT